MADVATLGLQAKFDSIEDATKALGDLSDAAAKTEKSADRLKGTSDSAAKGMDGLAKESKNADGALEKVKKSMFGTTGAADLLKGALAGAAAAFSVKAIVGMADAWSDMQSRVGAAIGDMSRAGDVMQRLVDVANASYSPLAQTVEIYGRNVAVLRDLGRNANEAADFTEALNHALVLTATRGQQAESVQNALSKAMAVGSLQADGLETILASGGEVAQLLADKLGTTVSGLRQMATDGKITGDVIATSLIGNIDTLRERAAEMPATVGDAFVRIQTNVLSLFGTLDQLLGASGALAEAFIAVADGIGWVGKNLQPIAGYAIEASIAMGILFGPVVLGGAASLLASIIRINVAIGVSMVSAIASAIKSMAAFMLSNPFTAIPYLVFVALAAIYTFRDSINNVFGFDLVNAAKTGINTVIQALFGMAEIAVTTFKNVPNIVGAAIIGAVNAVIGAIESMLQVGASAINSLISMANSLGAGLSLIDPKLPKVNNKPFANLSTEFESLGGRLDEIAQIDFIGELGTQIDGVTEKLIVAAGAATALNTAIGGGGTKPDDTGGGGGGGSEDTAASRLQAELEQRLQMLREHFYTEQEMLAQQRLENLETLDLARQAEMLSQDEYNAYKLMVEEQFQNQMRQIKGKEFANALGSTADFFGSMATLTEGGNKKMLAIQKAFSIAQALVNMYLAASQAMADWSTLTVAGKFAAVAAILAKGGALVASIKGVSTGGGASSSSGGVGGGAAAPTAAPEQRPVNTQAVEIKLHGEVYSREAVAELMNKMNDLSSDGFKLVIGTS